MTRPRRWLPVVAGAAVGAAAMLVAVAGPLRPMLTAPADAPRVATAAGAAMCAAMLHDLRTGARSQDWRIVHVARCLETGAIVEADLRDLGLDDALDRAQAYTRATRE